MNSLNFKIGGMAIIAAAMMLSSSASADTVGAGTVALGGTAMGSRGGVTFYFIAPGDTTATALGPNSGAFSTIMPATTQTIQPLTTANGVTPGPTNFDLVNFITLTDGIDLDATNIALPSISLCPTGTGTIAVNSTCEVNVMSPVVLQQTATGVTATLTLTGQAHFAGQTTYTPFTATFSASSTNFATVADLTDYFDANGGNIPAVPYTVDITTTAASTVPEPSSLAIVALGLIGCGFYRRGKKDPRSVV